MDAELLESLAPDLIVTQDLCHVCAASPEDLAAALTKLAKQPHVLSLTPHTLADVWDDIRRAGKAIGRSETAENVANGLACKVAEIARRAESGMRRGRECCVSNGSIRIMWVDIGCRR